MLSLKYLSDDSYLFVFFSLLSIFLFFFFFFFYFFFSHLFFFYFYFSYLFPLLLFSSPTADELSTEIINLVPKIDKARLYRGKGGELFRQASCFLIENISRCHFLVPVKLQLTLLDLLNENLKQPHAQLRIAAASALRWCVIRYFVLWCDVLCCV